MTSNKKSNVPTKNKYSFSTVAEHNQIDNAWTVINNKVYHIPESWILHDHPGGQIIRNAIGKDATEMFNFVGHSAMAK